MLRFVRRALFLLGVLFSTPLLGKADFAAMRLVDRLYQVYLGRSMNQGEANANATKPHDEIRAELIGLAEFHAAKRQRMTEFLAQAVGPHAALTRVPARSASLADMLGEVSPGHHDGKLCGEFATNAGCFAAWLSQRVAPAMDKSWISRDEKSIARGTYEDLVDRLAVMSLNQ